MADTRQIAEKIASALNMPVADVGKVLRTEHKIVQETVHSGEKVVLTGFMTVDRTAPKSGSDGAQAVYGARFTPGTTFRRLLHGESVNLAVTAPAKRVTDANRMQRRLATNTPVKATTKKATAPAAKKTAAKKAAAKKTTTKKATGAAAASKKTSTTKTATAAKKVATTRPVAKKATAKKTPAKKTSTPKKTTPARKTTAKRAVSKKTTKRAAARKKSR